MPRTAILMALLAATPACVHFRITAAPDTATWEDDLREGISSSSSSTSTRSWTARRGAHARFLAALGPDEEAIGQSLPVDEVARQLEQSMLRFTAERRMLASRISAQQAAEEKRGIKRDPGWPAPLLSLWDLLLGQLERGFDVPSHEVVPRRALLQARIATEVERELTERDFGTCPDELAKRIKSLHGLIAVLMRQSSGGGRSEPPALGAPKLEWPVTPVVFTSFFGYRRDPITDEVRFHTGVDLGASRGTLVNAAAPGRIVFSGWSGGYGQMIVVQHPSGYQTVYAHLSNIIVPDGVAVEAGQPLGQVGSSGRSTGPHLHFELRNGGVPVDPMRYLSLRYAAADSPDAVHMRR
jgi:murein DD-endopeptidase MepM/ murein hydrolase activator NlpD